MTPKGRGTPDVALGDTQAPSAEAVEATMAAPAAPAAPALGAVRGAADLPTVDAGCYEILGEHARGGLGRILRARDRRTGRTVAIKEMMGDGDETARRFAQEALVTANLQHPAIVPVYEVGRWRSGAPFYAMKLVAGNSLEQALRDRPGGLDLRLARLSVIVSVAEALAYAHGRGVIHRDLKPANVLVGDFGETVVIDWGLAKVVGRADDGPRDAAAEAIPTMGADVARTMDGAVMGTPAYMPPEQAAGDAVDASADVYAIGAMLYFLIAGRAPYLDRGPRDAADVLALVAREAPTPLAELEPAAPPDLVAIATQAMARDPKARYRSAAELAEDLRRFTTGQLVSAHRYDLGTLVRRWLRRHRAAVTVAASLLAVLVAGAAVSVQQIIGREREAVRARGIAEAARQDALDETRRAHDSLAVALYQKGRAAEATGEWARAAMYYASARLQHDSPEARWAAGYAEARAVLPRVRHAGHVGPVHAAAIAPDGERVATADESGQLRVWSPHDGALLASRRLSERPLHAVAFAPDGSELAVAGDEGTIWRLGRDLSTRGELRGHAGRVWMLAYAPDGGLLASAGEDGTARLWNLADGEDRVLRGHTQRVYSVAFSHDGKKLATGSDDRRVWLWDVATARGAPIGAHLAGGIRFALFIPGDDEIVTSGWDTEIRLWRAGHVGPVGTWTESNGVQAAAVSPDGGLLVEGGLVVHAWELGSHQLVASVEMPGGDVRAITFSRDGRWMVTTGGAGEAVAWDALGLRRLGAGGHRTYVYRLAFTRSGRRLVSSGGDHTLRAWDVASGHELGRIATAPMCAEGLVAIGEDQVASGCDDSTVRRWDVTGRELARLTTDVWLREAAISPDEKLLAAGHMDGRLALIDVASWRLLVEKTLHRHQIYGVALTGDGRLATASLDGHARVWRLPDLAPELDLDASAHEGLLRVAVSPDGRQIALAADDGALLVWDATAKAWLGPGGLVARLGPTAPMVYAPGGRRAYSVNGESFVRIWDPATWSLPPEADRLDAHEGETATLSVSPDGATLAVGYADGAIVLWDLATRTIRARFGGSTRDHGSCADLATAAWVDATHREIVTAACTEPPAAYAAELAARNHQRVDGDIDVRWEWDPPAR